MQLELEDQYGDPIRFPGADGGDVVTLVAVADREGAEANRDWAEALRRRYSDHLEGRSSPTLVVVPVAHLEGVPRWLRGIVKRRFRKLDRSGEPLLSIGLDWRGEAKRSLGLHPGVPNLSLFDPHGSLLVQEAGAVDAVAGKIFATLDRLLTGAAATARIEATSTESLP